MSTGGLKLLGHQLRYTNAQGRTIFSDPLSLTKPSRSPFKTHVVEALAAANQRMHMRRGTSDRPDVLVMSSATTNSRDRLRPGEWWVADEEPEIYPARRDRPDRLMPKASPRRIALAVLLAIAAGVGGALLL
jgi:hypothetical protein